MFLYKKSPFPGPSNTTRKAHPNKKAFEHGSDSTVISTPARAMAGINPFAPMPMLEEGPPRQSEFIHPSASVKTVSKPRPLTRRVCSEPAHKVGKEEPQSIQRSCSYTPGDDNKTSSMKYGNQAVSRGNQYPWGRNQSVLKAHNDSTKYSIESHHRVSSFIPSKYRNKKSVGYDLPELC
mmetsp:Transcript_23542/g.33023  ORF Transcript_23542/g.33023 Transcript_23542/m.33023 type:complete len:179 (-) Transcript_23542:215-751(-)